MKASFFPTRMSRILSSALLICALGQPAFAQDDTKDQSDASSSETEIDEEVIETGREIYLEVAQPACGICHVLEDAETRGPVGPNLDDLEPTADQVRNALMSGPGAMPEYGGRLDEDQIDAVAQYVAHVTGADDSETGEDDDADMQDDTDEKQAD